MVADTSAATAILLGEPESGRSADRIAVAAPCRVAMASVVETNSVKGGDSAATGVAPALPP